jgi:hypothetical protein
MLVETAEFREQEAKEKEQNDHDDGDESDDNLPLSALRARVGKQAANGE